MPGNRAAAQKFIIEQIHQIIPDNHNRRVYEDLFAGMSDAQFDAYMKKMEEGTVKLMVVAPNLAKTKLSVERNLAIGKKLGHSFFERIWMKDSDDSPMYLSPHRYLIVDLPVRRQAQFSVKKSDEGIPEDNRSIDELTGQPTGKSKGSKISYPETQVLAAMGLNNSLTEFLKYRGGDIKGFNAMNRQIAETGSTSMKAVQPYAGTVQSTLTLKTYLTGMHISSSGLVT
jgi:hypothetical protein